MTGRQAGDGAAAGTGMDALPRAEAQSRRSRTPRPVEETDR